MRLENSKMEKPARPCQNCGGSKWWQRISGGHWICSGCYSDLNAIKVGDSE